MRPIKRLPLSADTEKFLRERTARVSRARNKPAAAKRLWKQKGNKAFAEIRKQLKNMASGLERCMYCEDSEPTRERRGYSHNRRAPRAGRLPRDQEVDSVAGPITAALEQELVGELRLRGIVV